MGWSRTAAKRTFVQFTAQNLSKVSTTCTRRPYSMELRDPRLHSVLPGHCQPCPAYGWWRGTVVERRSLAGELSLSCARRAADG